MNRMMITTTRRAPRQPNGCWSLLVVPVLLGLVVRVVRGGHLSPPSPNFHQYESVYEYRDRLNISYGYRPQHLSDEYCRFLNESECQRHDEHLAHARHHRRLNPSLLTGAKILVLLVKFKDQANVAVPPRTYFDTLLNGVGKSAINPVGSLRNWLRYNSLGKYQVTFDVRDWAMTDNTEAYFAAGVSGQVGPDQIQALFSPVLSALDSAGLVNWTDGYVDDQGYIYGLIVIHSGVGAQFGDLPCVPNKAINRIWSQGCATSANGWTSPDFNTVNGFALSTAFSEPSCNSTNPSQVVLPYAKMNVFAHEYSHGYGLIDLYDRAQPALHLNIEGTRRSRRLVLSASKDNGEQPVGQRRNLKATTVGGATGGVGAFDVMSHSSGWGSDGTMPGHLSSYSKILANWIDPILITQDGYYAIQPLEVSNQIYKINHSFPTGEYLLIENKQPIKWDANIPTGGIVIYHVDETKSGQTQRGYPGYTGWPSNGNHYEVSVLQADMLYELEEGKNSGDVGDYWRKGMTLAAGIDKWPNTASFQTGKVGVTGVVIEIVTDPSFVMAIKVSGISSGRTSTLESRAADNSTAELESRQAETDTTGTAIHWILSLLGGIALMVGLMVVLL